MKVAKELAKEAKKFKICQEWHTELKRLDDKEKMIQMYLKGIDFCLSHDYPSNDYVRANFKGIMEKFGVFLDDAFDLVNVEKCVALGATKGSIEINNFYASEIFVKHTSELTVMAKGDAFVMVDIFDDAVLHIHIQDRAKVCVNRYGNAIVDHKQSDFGMVKIIEKLKKTY